MLHRSTHPTTLTALCNIGVIALTGIVVYTTGEPLALLGLFAVRDLPFVVDELNVKLAELNMQDGPTDDDEDPYSGTRAGFVKSE